MIFKPEHMFLDNQSCDVYIWRATCIATSSFTTIEDERAPLTKGYYGYFFAKEKKWRMTVFSKLQERFLSFYIFKDWKLKYKQVLQLNLTLNDNLLTMKRDRVLLCSINFIIST